MIKLIEEFKMSILDLKNMTKAQKFMAMEELWEDMSKNVNSEDLTPQWHLDVLEKREKRIQNGDLKFFTFEEAEERLQRLVTK